MASRTRARNPRGQGERLAAEITQAAARLVEHEGEAAVTLRAVAREAGITAPSIYAHFPDRDAILLALTRQLFEELRLAIVSAVEQAGADPVAQLLAGSRAYLAYGTDHPARYALLFAPTRPLPTRPSTRPGDLGAIPAGASAFAILMDGVAACAAAGRSASADPFTDATAVWVALHGIVELRRALPGFPWPAAATLLDTTVRALARIDATRLGRP